MDDYFAKMKNFFDQLAVDRAPLNLDDFILHTLNVLDAEYNAIFVKLAYQPALTWVVAQASLLAFSDQKPRLW